MSVMRTTINLDDEALDLARTVARRRGITLGQAVSELVRRGARQPIVTESRHGLQVIRLPGDSPRVTAELVRAVAEEQP